MNRNLTEDIQTPARGTLSTVLHDPQSVKIKIDKLSLTCSGLFYPEEIRTVCEKVTTLATEKSVRGLQVGSSSGYAVNATFPVTADGGDQHTVLFQTGRYGRIGADVRCEFNPHKCGRAGWDQTQEFLRTVLPMQDLTSFLRQARVTRIDLAIDLPGLSLDEVIVRLKRTRKHGVYTSTTGQPETTYLGGERSNRAVAYNRRLDRDNPGQILRIERRLKPRVRLPELIGLANPFINLIAVATAPLRPLITDIHPDIVFDSMRTRGVQRSLRLLGSPQRRILTAAIDDPANSLMPSVDELWAQWPQVLRDVGLSFPQPDPDGQIQ